jgi:hypothetical protein
MLDNQIIALIIQILLAGEATAGIPGTPIKQAFQPTMQGVNTQPTAYIYKVGDHRYGFTRRVDEWDTDDEVIKHIEIQQYETTFQLSALATQNPSTPNQYTASDICNLCASILASSVAIQTLETQSPPMGIQKISNARNPYFLDDFQQNEANPSFDFVISHKQVIKSTTPIITTTDIGLYEV